MTFFRQERPSADPIVSIPIAWAYGCLDCHRVSSALTQGRCPVCGSLHVYPIAELWERLKTMVSPTGKKRLLLPLPKSFRTRLKGITNE